MFKRSLETLIHRTPELHNATIILENFNIQKLKCFYEGEAAETKKLIKLLLIFSLETAI